MCSMREPDGMEAYVCAIMYALYRPVHLLEMLCILLTVRFFQIVQCYQYDR